MKSLYIITGTSKGLGKALVENVNKSTNNTIYCISRSETVLEQPINKTNTIKSISFDLLNFSEINKRVSSIFSETKDTHYDNIVLINNAALLPPLIQIDKADFDEINNSIDLNVKTLIHMTASFLKETKDLDTNKVIVNLSSGAAQSPTGSVSVYNASKAAVEMFTQSVALEQEEEKYPTKLFAFQPGKVETDMQVFVRTRDPKDFPHTQVFIDAKKNGGVFSAEFVAEKLIKLINDKNLENGKVYKIKEMIGKN